MTIYDNVKAAADRQKKTIAAIENEAGISNGIISKWRDNNNPKVENLQKVASVLGVSIEDLLTDG